MHVPSWNLLVAHSCKISYVYLYTAKLVDLYWYCMNTLTTGMLRRRSSIWSRRLLARWRLAAHFSEELRFLIGCQFGPRPPKHKSLSSLPSKSKDLTTPPPSPVGRRRRNDTACPFAAGKRWNPKPSRICKALGPMGLDPHRGVWAWPRSWKTWSWSTSWAQSKEAAATSPLPLPLRSGFRTPPAPSWSLKVWNSFFLKPKENWNSETTAIHIECLAAKHFHLRKVAVQVGGWSTNLPILAILHLTLPLDSINKHHHPN
jgi:hypothetical protein